MKKCATLALLFIVAIGFSQDDDTISKQEPQFGLKAGYSSIVLRVSLDGSSGSDNASGFYLGAFTEINISQKFSIQPELLYASYSEDGESTGVLFLPVMAKYYANDKFSLYAGPQLDYLLNEEDAVGFNRLGLGIGLGACIDLSDNVFIDARYSFGLSNRIDDDAIFDGFDPVISDADIKANFNYLQIGLGYKF